MYLTCVSDPVYAITTKVAGFDGVLSWVGVHDPRRDYPTVAGVSPVVIGQYVRYVFQGLLLTTKRQRYMRRMMKRLGDGWFAAVRLLDLDIRRARILSNGMRLHHHGERLRVSLDRIADAPNERILQLVTPSSWSYVYLYFRRRRYSGRHTKWQRIEYPPAAMDLLFPQGYPLTLHDCMDYWVVAKVYRQLAPTDVVGIIGAMQSEDTLCDTYLYRRRAARGQRGEAGLIGLQSLQLSAEGAGDWD